MREVAVIGVGMHPWGKFAEKSITQLCREAVVAALADADVAWREVEAVAAASSRFSGGKGWGLNGNDIVEEMGPTGVPVYNLSAGCAAGGNAFNIGHTLVASGLHDVVLVVGGEKMPKGFIQTSGVEEETDLEYLRQLAVGMPGPAFWGLLASRRMADHGTTEEQLARIAVKAHQVAKHNENARFRQEFTLEDVLTSPLVSYPLRLYEICPVSDGAAAVVLCSADEARKRATKPVWVASSTVATSRFADGVPRGLATVVPPGVTHTARPPPACAAPLRAPGRRRRMSTWSSCRTTRCTTSWPSRRSGASANRARRSRWSSGARRCRPVACRSIPAAASSASARRRRRWASSRCAS